MNDQLSSGGTTPTNLPDRRWKAPWGYPRTGQDGAIWTGGKPATQEAIDTLHRAGWTEDEASLVGTLDPEWTAAQYVRKHGNEISIEPWETLPMPGGMYSARFKFQHLPRGVKIAHPRWWVVGPDGDMYRAKGGEPVTKVDVCDGHYEYHVVPDLEVSWDASMGVWRT